MTEKGFAMGSIRRVAKQIVDLGDKKRKEVLMTFDSDMRCRIIEEMVKIYVNYITAQSRNTLDFIQKPSPILNVSATT